MTVAQVGISTTYNIDMTQLEYLQSRGEIDQFEINSQRNLITLYWNSMAERESKTVDLKLIRKFDGTSSVTKPRPSAAYPYYNDDKKVWITDHTYDTRCYEKDHDYSKLVRPQIPFEQVGSNIRRITREELDFLAEHDPNHEYHEE